MNPTAVAGLVFALPVLSLTLLSQAGGVGNAPLPPRNGQQGVGVGVIGPGGARGAIPGGPGMFGPPALPRGVQELQPGVFTIHDTRPMEVAADLLSRKLGVPISSEEPAWLSSRDVIRGGDYPGNPPALNTLIPRGGTITLSIPSSRPADITAVIQAAIDSHRENRNPGEFKLIRLANDAYSIVADYAEDEKGTVVKQSNPLDQRISFPEMDRSIAETLALIYRSAVEASNKSSSSRKITIVDLAGPTYSFTTRQIRLGAHDEVSRDILLKTLREAGFDRTYWSLRFDPQSKIYGIALKAVP